MNINTNIKKTLFQQLFILFFFLILASAPPLFSVVFGLDSHSFGILFSSLVLVVLIRKLVLPSSMSVVVFIFFLFYFAIQHIFVGEWQPKSYYSFPLFVFMSYVSYACAKSLCKIDPIVLERSFVLFFYFLTALGFVHLLSSYSLGRVFGFNHAKQMFPFSEPSHFALFYGSFFVFYVARFTPRIGSFVAVLFALILALLIPSTTLLVMVAIGFSVLLSRSKLGAFFAVTPVLAVLTIFATMFVSSNEYFSSRLNISPESDNLSSLVYLQGWSDARRSLGSTNGLGLGFQMLGTQPPSIYAFRIAQVMGDSTAESNRQDGGFLAAKIVSELGYAGFLLIGVYLYLLLRSFSLMRVSSASSAYFDGAGIVAASIVIAFSVELFARSVGYFSSQVMIFMVAAFYLHNTGFAVKSSWRVSRRSSERA